MGIHARLNCVLRNGAIFIAIKYANGVFEVVSEFCDRLKLLLHVCCTRQRRKQKAPVCIYHPNRCTCIL